ncbi:MAG: DUF2835 domain-containing protein [Pseudomonadota bacterium]|nr:DUF2835 domain-containing protein [Pseudomonadota bacterium]
MSQRIVLDLNISADEYLRYYRGSARTVLATSVDGRNVRFPANVLQHAVTHDGVQGRFAIVFNDDGKFERIERLA